MKKLLFFASLIFSTLAFGQVTDDFSDGNFTNNPAWSGDEAKFIVNANNQLQLNAPAVTDDAYLSTPSSSINNAVWEFFVLLDFNPSASNYTRIYLVSDQADLRNPLNGYFVLVGGTSDEISLFKQSGATTTKIIQGVASSVSLDPVLVNIKVTRDDVGNWTLERDLELDGTFVLEGSIFDDTHVQSGYFGFYCDYTATRSTSFFYDDVQIIGDAFVDTEAPVFQTIDVVSNTEIRLNFNENLGAPSVSTSNFLVNNGIGSPSIVDLNPLDNKQLVLQFSNPFVDNQTYQINIANVQDPTGNITPTFTEEFINTVFSIPLKGEIRINEFMADESPSVGQPATEYVELFNTTNKAFDLSGYKICNDNSCGTIQTSALLPNAYLIITPTSGVDLFPDQNVINATSFPGLKNSGDNIALLNPTQTDTLDFLVYTLATYQDPLKEDGGYSIELINPFNFCLGQGNYRATNSPLGGTPGEINSIYDDSPDTINPSISAAFASASNALSVQFSELLTNEALNNIGFTSSFSSPLEEVIIVGSYTDSATFIFTNDFAPNVVYSFTISNVEDCAGNVADLTGDFVLPDLAQKGDIVINEILFNPVTGGVDFVEIYNNSEKFINLKNWNMANISNFEPANFKLISSGNLIMEPGAYFALTVDSAQVKQTYINHGVGRFLYCDLPTYSNDAGNVLLVAPSNAIIDSVSYDDSWHFRLIDDEKGKSLERIDPSGESNSSDNWQTASETVGWGTPGLQNSQYLNPQANGSLEITPSVISPDNDGFEDFALLTYDLPELGMIGTIYIFDEQGRKVRELVNNFYFDQFGNLKWDGLDDNGLKCRIGRYLIHFEALSAVSGEIIVLRKGVVLSGKI